QMRVHQLEAVGLPPRRVLPPLAGVGALGVPPDRVVVEVADHEHRPTGLGDREVEVRAGTGSAHPRGPPLTDNGTRNGDRDLDDLLAGFGERLPTQAVAVDSDWRRFGDPGDGDAG